MLSLPLPVPFMPGGIKGGLIQVGPRVRTTAELIEYVMNVIRITPGQFWPTPPGGPLFKPFLGALALLLLFPDRVADGTLDALMPRDKETDPYKKPGPLVPPSVIEYYPDPDAPSGTTYFDISYQIKSIQYPLYRTCRGRPDRDYPIETEDIVRTEYVPFVQSITLRTRSSTVISAGCDAPFFGWKPDVPYFNLLEVDYVTGDGSTGTYIPPYVGQSDAVNGQIWPKLVMTDTWVEIVEVKRGAIPQPIPDPVALRDPGRPAWAKPITPEPLIEPLPFIPSPAPEPLPEPLPDVVPLTEPYPDRRPIPLPGAPPMPDPEAPPAPGPAPLPLPSPVPGPTPAPDPVPAPFPQTDPDPQRVPAPNPWPTPVRTPDPAITPLPRVFPSTPQEIAPDGSLVPLKPPVVKPTPADAHFPVPGGDPVTSGGARSDITTIAKEIGRIEQKTAAALNRLPGPLHDWTDWLDTIGDALEIQQNLSDLLAGPVPATQYTLTGVCEEPDDQGMQPVFSAPIGEQPAFESLMRRVDALSEMMQIHLEYKTPICGPDEPLPPLVEGDWVTAQWISDEASSDSPLRLRKRTRYRSKSGRSDSELAEYFGSFTWEAGPVCVKHSGGWWGYPQVWAASIDEGKRVIRHLAREAGIDPDTDGRWEVAGSRNPRFGRTGTMRLRTIAGFPWVSSRQGSNMLPMG